MLNYIGSMVICFFIGVLITFMSMDKEIRSKNLSKINIPQTKIIKAVKDDSTIIDEVKVREGFKSYVYKCPSGFYTIGYGINIDERSGMGIDSVEAEWLLKRRIVLCEDNLKDIFGNYYDTLSKDRKLVLINLMYSLGQTRFKKFTYMIDAIKKRKWKLASKELLNSKIKNQIKRVVYYSELLKGDV